MGFSHYNVPELTQTRKKLRNNATKYEKILWEYLKGKKFLGLKFRRQHSIGRYVLDFYCPSVMLGIEIDGEVHSLEERQEYDDIRTEYISSDGIIICRFTNFDVEYNTKQVLTNLEEFIKGNILASPPGEGGDGGEGLGK